MQPAWTYFLRAQPTRFPTGTHICTSAYICVAYSVILYAAEMGLWKTQKEDSLNPSLSQRLRKRERERNARGELLHISAYEPKLIKYCFPRYIRTQVTSPHFGRFFYWDAISRCVCTGCISTDAYICTGFAGNLRERYAWPILLLLPMPVWHWRVTACPAGWFVLRTSYHILCHRLLFLCQGAL